MQRKSLQPYVVYAYGWSADGSSALPMMLLKVSETYRRGYDPARKYTPAGTNELVQAGRRRAETGYLAVLGTLATPISALESLPQDAGFLDVVVLRGYQPPSDLRLTLLTRPGYLNGPWADRAGVYEASRLAARERTAGQERASQESRERLAARDQLGAETAQRLAVLGYDARYERGAVVLDTDTAARLAATLGST